MTVAFDAQTTHKLFAAPTAGSTTFDYLSSDAGAITVGSGANRVIVFPISWPSGAATTISSVTWDQGGTNQAAAAIPGASFSMTGAAFANKLQVQLWGLVAPTSGQKTWRVVTSGTPSDIYLAAVSYTGANQSGGASSFANGTGNGNTSSSSSPSLPVTSATGDATVATWLGDGPNWTTTSGTNIYIDNTGGSVSQGAANRDVGAATVTMTVSPAGEWVGAACDVVAAAAGGDTLGGAMPMLMMSRRRRDPVKTLVLPSRWRRRTRGFALAA